MIDKFFKLYFNFGKNKIHFLYPNNYIKTIIFHKETDDTIQVDEKNIIKKTTDAYIDMFGNKNYFVNGEDLKTDIPFPNSIISTPHKDISRETIFYVTRNNLLRAMNNVTKTNILMFLSILLAGMGMGYMIGSYYGTMDDYSTHNTDIHNYPTNETEGKTDIIISAIPFNIFNFMTVPIMGIDTKKIPFCS